MVLKKRLNTHYYHNRDLSIKILVSQFLARCLYVCVSLLWWPENRLLLSYNYLIFYHFFYDYIVKCTSFHLKKTIHLKACVTFLFILSDIFSALPHIILPDIFNRATQTGQYISVNILGAEVVVSVDGGKIKQRANNLQAGAATGFQPGGGQEI